ncbi:phage major capsid protein [Komagataeibacter nataicola]|uniref:Phage major capsid protein n=1 Tax=Komagataeibacter nataicola TaxID=265960 RepID=A0ABX5P9T3_9PROT|nr:phage major capsid protein [Komagataeibacter nataicola]PYD65238.1 phage major capsid protein [Komagataeibacter nataicola]WNM07313.1 phage major capsid protein [Komagataeibacter nataicola]
MAFSIKELKRKVSQHKSRLKELADEICDADEKDEDSSDLTNEFDELKAKIAKLEENIKRKEEAEENSIDDDKDEDEVADEKLHTPTIVKGQIGDKLNPAFGLGRKAVLGALNKTKGYDQAKKIFSNTFGVKEYEQKIKDLSSTSQPLVAPEYKGFIELVRAKTVIRDIANIIDMSTNGNVSIPRAIAGSTAEWVGEGQIIPSSAPDFDTVNLLWKKIAVTSSMTKELAMFGAFDVARYVSEDLARQLAIGEDASLINNTSRSETSPNGLMGYTTTSGNVLSATKNDFASINQALYGALSFIRGKNFSENLVWIMPVQTELFLRSVSTDLGIYPFADQMDRTGKLFGAEVRSTNLIPTNKGTGNNVGSIFLVDPNYLQFGTASSLESQVTDVGSLSDSTGKVTANAYAQDLILFKVTERLDFQLTLDNAAFRIDATAWALNPDGSVPYNTQNPNYAGSDASGAKGKTNPSSGTSTTTTGS